MLGSARIAKTASGWHGRENVPRLRRPGRDQNTASTREYGGHARRAVHVEESLSPARGSQPIAAATMAADPDVSAARPRLLDCVRQEIRLRRYSRRTEQAYVGWIRRFVVFNGKRHPRQIGEREVTAFLSDLAARGVSASTQNQALSAVLFLYEVVVGRRLEWMDGIVRARRPARLPVVLSRGGVILACAATRSRMADGVPDVRGRSEAARVQPAVHRFGGVRIAC